MNSGRNWLCQSSVQVFEIEEFPFDGKPIFHHLEKRHMKLKKPSGSSVRSGSQICSLLTRAKAKTSFRNQSYRHSGKIAFTVLAFYSFETANKEPLELEEVMLLHVLVGDLELQVWFGAVKKLAVDIFVGTSFLHRNVRGVLFSSQETALRHSKPVYIRAFERKDERSAIPVIANDILSINRIPTAERDPRCATGSDTSGVE